MSRRERARQALKCAYCGAPAKTKDHVPPRSLFVRPYPANLVTVPSCFKCNQKKALDDALLRDALTSDIEAQPNKTAIAAFRPVPRSVERNRSEFARIVNSQTIRRRSLVTEAGLYLGKAFGVTLPRGRIERCLFWIVRGLYFDHQKEPFPTDVTYEVGRHPVSGFPALLSGLGSDGLPPHRIVGDVFGCTYVRGIDLRDSIWLLWFYERIVFSVITQQSSTRANPP